MIRNHREEIAAALRGETPATVPLTFYDGLIPPGFSMGSLQTKGLAIAARRQVYRKTFPDVRVKRVSEPTGSVRISYETPVGTLHEVKQRGGYGSLSPVEHPVKTRDDYRIAEFIVRNARYEAAYESFQRDRVGDAGFAFADTQYSPLIDIQVTWLGQERFCYEIADNEDAVMSLYETLVDDRRKMYGIVAKGPADVCLYGGNIVAEMVGLDRVAKYVAPCWREFAAALHEEGKTLGVHLDADNRIMMQLIADSPLDFIEAFTPPPDCSVSVEEARGVWPGKVLWVNLPPSVLVGSDDGIRRAVREILAQAPDRRGFLLGITEDIPEQHIERSLAVALDTIAESSRTV